MISLDIAKKLYGPLGDLNLDVSLEIKKGEFITLYGESGSGKTSLLRILAGLMTPEKGKIRVNDQLWFDSESRTCFRPQQRQVGYVFQDYALFPHMTVLQNLEFARPKSRNKRIIEELVETVELGELQNQKPQTLSGGQKQRVALARALVGQPQLLMLDEPLSALDYKMRLKLQEYILNVHLKYGLTTILVSHDPGEIIKLSDKVFELHQGKVIKSGKPSDFFGIGRTSAKFSFTGEIVNIQKEDFLYIITILVGKDIVKVIADKSEATQLSPGDKVIVGSKAFNPIIQKL